MARGPWKPLDFTFIENQLITFINSVICLELEKSQTQWGPKPNEDYRKEQTQIVSSLLRSFASGCPGSLKKSPGEQVFTYGGDQLGKTRVPFLVWGNTPCLFLPPLLSVARNRTAHQDWSTAPCACSPPFLQSISRLPCSVGNLAVLSEGEHSSSMFPLSDSSKALSVTVLVGCKPIKFLFFLL